MDRANYGRSKSRSHGAHLSDSGNETENVHENDDVAIDSVATSVPFRSEKLFTEMLQQVHSELSPKPPPLARAKRKGAVACRHGLSLRRKLAVGLARTIAQGQPISQMQYQPQREPQEAPKRRSGKKGPKKPDTQNNAATARIFFSLPRK